MKSTMAALPDHQRRDVPERAERAAGVRRHDDIDTGDTDKPPVALANGQHHRAHHERRGQIVDDGRQEKADDTRDPEEPAVTETPAHEPGAQCVEDPPLAHRIDVGHRAQQEQKEFAELDQEMFDGLMGLMVEAAHGILGGDDRPDRARREHDGHGFSQVRELFDDDEGVRHDKNRDGRESDPMRREIHNASLQSCADPRPPMRAVSRRGLGVNKSAKRGPFRLWPFDETDAIRDRQQSGGPVSEQRSEGRRDLSQFARQ